MYFDRELWQATRGFRGRIMLAVLLGFLALAAGIARFALLGWLIARLFEGAPIGDLMLPVGAVVAVVILRGLLDHGRARIAQGTAAAIQEQMRARIYDRIVALGPAWFSGQRTGGVMLSAVDGVEQLQTFFGQYLPQLSIALLAPLAIFGFMAFWDLPVALVLLGFALFTLVLPIAFHRWDRAASMARQRAFKSFGEEFLDAVQGLPTLKAFGQSGSFGIRLAERARALSNTTMWVLSTGLMTRGVTDIGVALGAAAAIALGAYRVSSGVMSLEALLIVLMAGTEIFRPLRDLRSVLHQGMVGQSAAAGIKALLAGEEAAAAPAESVEILAPSVRFQDVRFAYPGGRRAAHDGLDFEIAAGERVGIVGASGSGKSSIVRLLLGLNQAQGGAVRIGGHDVAALDPALVRRHIAVVQQDTYLFHGTVEENLRLGRPDASRAELEAAARTANAHDFIMALPDGYATLIGERGTRLSGGQRQRVAIARALLRDAPILILDEALSAVDAENEAVIQAALDRLMQGRTTLILAHRLSSVIGADRILVLDRGRVVESGHHGELIRRDGIYRQLMGSQAAPDEILPDLDQMLPAPVSAAPEEAEVEAAPLPAQPLGARRTLATLMRFIRPWRRQLSVTILAGIGRVGALIAVGIIGAMAVAALKQGEPFQGLVLALLLVAPVSGLLHWSESWLAHDMAYRLLAELRIQLFAQLDRLAPAYLLRRRSGDLVALATQDVETVEYFFAHTVAPALVAVLVPSAVLVALGILAWPTALALLPFLLWAGLAPVLGRRRIDRLGSQARKALGEMGAHVTETIQGLPELIAFEATGRRRADFLALVRRYGAMRRELLGDLSVQAASLDVMTGLGGLAIVVAGGLLAGSGTIDAHLVPLLTLIGTAAFLPVSEIGQAGRQLADTIASTQRLQVVHSEPVLVRDGTRPLPPAVAGSAIRFDQVGFRYPGRGRAVLSEVGFEVPAGATVAIVGASGAGKTTIANLLLRFWDPEQGAIRIDGTDIRELPLDLLRTRIALVAQDTYLFNGTLEQNVRLARPEAGEEEVRAAIEQAALAEFVADLPDGLATQVGERGVQLSGGQRQRVAIARAFLKNAPILILDEATSHLDAVSEAKVREALSALMAGRTTIAIAHRLSTVRDADLILVLGEGRLREFGSHAELVARGGLYSQLVRTQVGLAS